jgi:hypothetical protein
MSPVRRIAASILGAVALAAALATPVVGAPAAGVEEPQQLYAYSFRYQQAIESIALIQPLLSSRGTLELQPRSNTVVIRDSAVALGRILPVLRSYDHPRQPLRLEVMIVKASRSAVSPQYSGLPEELTRRLRQLLPYDTYVLNAQAALATREGEAVVYNVGEDYEVTFRLGTMMEDHRVKLSGFEVERRISHRAVGVPLIHTTLNIGLDEPLCLGLARDEASREAFMIVLILHRGDATARVQR